MEQTRVKAGHIELVQGSKYTKRVKLMLLICARDKRRSNISKRIFFFLWVIRVLAEPYTFLFIAYFKPRK